MGRSRVRFGPFTLDTRLGVSSSDGGVVDHPEQVGGSLEFGNAGPAESSPTTNYPSPLINSSGVITDPRLLSRQSKSVTVGAGRGAAYVSVTERIVNDNASVLRFTNTDTTQTAITTDNTIAPGASTATSLGTQPSTSAREVLAGLHKALTLAQTAGSPANLKMSISPVTWPATNPPDSIELVQNIVGVAGNTTIQVVSSYTPNTADDLFLLNGTTDKRSSARFLASAFINGTTATTLTLINTDTTQTTFTTDNTVAPGASTATKIGTLGAITDTLATQALHRSFTLAQAAGVPANLKMTISPAAYSAGNTRITLTQDVPGAAGNTSITVPAGDTILTGPAGTNASATFKCLVSINGDNGSTVTLINYDGTSHTFTTDNTKIATASTSTLIGTLNITTSALAAQSLHVAFSAAIAASNLKMTLSPVAYSASTGVLTLTQNRALASGNTAITVPAANFIQAQGSAASTGAIRIFGLVTLNNQNGTTLTLINTDTTTHTFTTDNTKVPTASTSTLIGTSGANTELLATQAIHTAVVAAITAGNLKMTVLPALWTHPVNNLTLRQQTPGVAGNTLATLPTGVSMGAGDGVNGNFAGGANAAAATFTGGADAAATSFRGGVTAPVEKFSGGTDPDIDVFMDGQPISGVATVSMPDGTYQSDVIELHTSLLAFHRFTISAVEADNGASTAPANMDTITVYGLFGSNYKDQDSRNQPTPFSGPPYVQGGFQQVTLGTLTRAAPVFAWDDRMKTTTTAGTDTSESPLPFITGIRLSFAPAATGVIRVYIDAERDF